MQIGTALRDIAHTAQISQQLNGWYQNGTFQKPCDISSWLPQGLGNNTVLLMFQCEELLESLGVRCYKSDGEAEALCSRLNELGVS